MAPSVSYKKMAMRPVQLLPFLGPLGFNSPNIAQRHALHVERTAEKAFMLSDTASGSFSSVQEIYVGSWGGVRIEWGGVRTTGAKPTPQYEV